MGRGSKKQNCILWNLAFRSKRRRLRMPFLVRMGSRCIFTPLVRWQLAKGVAQVRWRQVAVCCSPPLRDGCRMDRWERIRFIYFSRRDGAGGMGWYGIGWDRRGWRKVLGSGSFSWIDYLALSDCCNSFIIVGGGCVYRWTWCDLKCQERKSRGMRWDSRTIHKTLKWGAKKCCVVKVIGLTSIGVMKANRMSCGITTQRIRLWLIMGNIFTMCMIVHNWDKFSI